MKREGQSHSLSRRHFLTLSLASALFPSSCSRAVATSFTVYDALIYPKKPSIGLQPIWVNGGGFWNGKDRSNPYEVACRETARKAAQRDIKFVIDVEHWPINCQATSKEEVKPTISKMLQIIDWMKQESPSLEIGVYGFPPIRDYWTPVRGQLDAMQAWKEANDFLSPIAERVDFLAPSLYTFYDDMDGWITYASANIAEALRFKKPVLPFLWCRYHNSNKKLKFTLIPGDFWKKQLQTVRESGASGVVLWDWYGDNQPKTGVLDTQQEWWQQTRAFVNNLKR